MTKNLPETQKQERRPISESDILEARRAEKTIQKAADSTAQKIELAIKHGITPQEIANEPYEYGGFTD